MIVQCLPILLWFLLYGRGLKQCYNGTNSDTEGTNRSNALLNCTGFISPSALLGRLAKDE